MYVPEAFTVADEAYAHEVIDGHGFALLVTAADGPPQASHLPFLYVHFCDIRTGGVNAPTPAPRFTELMRLKPIA